MIFTGRAGYACARASGEASENAAPKVARVSKERRDSLNVEAPSICGCTYEMVGGGSGLSPGVPVDTFSVSVANDVPRHDS